MNDTHSPAEPSVPSPAATATLARAVDAVPAGRWAVGVSGGADSVALLLLLRDRAAARGDLSPYVVHLDHQTRAGESARDAEFVQSLAERWSLLNTRATLAEVEAIGGATRARNPSARYRAARHQLFRQAVTRFDLRGVLLAHHAGDQVETIFQRLARGAGITGLGGMTFQTTVRDLLIVRPLLAVPGEALRDLLRTRGVPWREDASNASTQYQRNRVRRLLRGRPGISASLLELGTACASLREWMDAAAPQLDDCFPTRLLRQTPEPLAAHAARRWLAARGVTIDDITPATVARLLSMACDAASPTRAHFPGAVLVRRRAGDIWAESARASAAR